MFHYTVSSKKTMEAIVEALESNLKEAHFGILWQFDIEKTLENKGFEYQNPYLVLEVCNPKEAYSMLEQNQMVGYFLPCKLVIYQDGETMKIGMPKPTELIQLVEDPSLKQQAKDIEDRLISVINQSK